MSSELTYYLFSYYCSPIKVLRDDCILFRKIESKGLCSNELCSNINSRDTSLEYIQSNWIPLVVLLNDLEKWKYIMKK